MSEQTRSAGWWPPLVLVATAAATGMVLYGSLIGMPPSKPWPDFDDSHIIGAYRQVESGQIGFFKYLLLAHGDHTLPLGRLLYWALAKVFGVRWEPFGVVLFLSYVGATAAPGIAAWTMTRRLSVGWALTLLFAASVPASTLVTSISVYFLVYSACALGTLSIVWTYQYHRAASRRLRARYGFLVLAACLLSFTIVGSGVLTIVAAGFAHVALTVADGLRQRGAMRRAAGKNLALLCLIAGAAVIYALVIVAGVRVAGNPLPGSVRYPELANCRFDWNYVLDHYNYATLGWLWPQAIIDQNDGPFAGFVTLKWLWLVVIGGLSLRGLFLLLLRPEQEEGNRRQLGAIIVSCVAISVTGEVANMVGRGPCLLFWMFRYAIYTMPPIALALALVVAEWIEGIPSGARRLLLVALSVVSLGYSVKLGSVVTHSTDYVRRLSVGAE